MRLALIADDGNGLSCQGFGGAGNRVGMVVEATCVLRQLIMPRHAALKRYFGRRAEVATMLVADAVLR